MTTSLVHADALASEGIESNCGSVFAVVQLLAENNELNPSEIARAVVRSDHEKTPFNPTRREEREDACSLVDRRYLVPEKRFFTRPAGLFDR